MTRALTWPFVAVIRLYQVSIGRLLPERCRFEPSCSSYALLALRRNGPVVGGAQAMWRLLRCGPWTRGGVDEPREIHLFRAVLRRPGAPVSSKPNTGISL